MKIVIKTLLISLLLSGCNINTSSSFSSNSSFIGVDDIKDIIIDPGNSEETKVYYVEGKVVTNDNKRVLPFNTSMTLTTYSESVYNSLGPVYDYHIKRLHILFDRYNNYNDSNGKLINNLKVINDSYATNKEIIIDKDLFNLLEISLELAKLTEGYFNPTMGYLIDGWNNYFTPYSLVNDSFTKEEETNIIKRKETIIPYDKLEEIIVLDKNKTSVIFKEYKNSINKKPIISLGAIAKGYAIDYLREKYERHTVPLIISGSGSSTYLKGINPNPTRNTWGVQINSPYKDDIFYSSYPLLVSQADPETAVSTSGDYEQLFYYKNNDELIRRHHILNPYSGYSSDYFRSITLYSETRSDVLDGLSTALFNIEDFKIIKRIINNIEGTYKINIDYLFQKEVSENTLNIYLNEGFEKTIKSYSENDKFVINEIVRVE